MKYSIRLNDEELKIVSRFLNGDKTRTLKRGEALGYKRYGDLGPDEEFCNNIPHGLLRQIRRLYGVLAINAVPCGRYYMYRDFYVPKSNLEASRDAQSTGIFEKDILPDDVNVLRFVYERSRELQQKRMNGQYGQPKFHANEIHKRTGKDAHQSLYRLTGMLAQVVTCEGRRREPDVAEDGFFVSRWLLPTAHLADAEKLLDKNI